MRIDLGPWSWTPRFKSKPAQFHFLREIWKYSIGLISYSLELIFDWACFNPALVFHSMETGSVRVEPWYYNLEKESSWNSINIPGWWPYELKQWKLIELVSNWVGCTGSRRLDISIVVIDLMNLVQTCHASHVLRRPLTWADQQISWLLLGRINWRVPHNWNDLFNENATTHNRPKRSPMTRNQHGGWHPEAPEAASAAPLRWCADRGSISETAESQPEKKNPE